MHNILIKTNIEVLGIAKRIRKDILNNCTPLQYLLQRYFEILANYIRIISFD